MGNITGHKTNSNPGLAYFNPLEDHTICKGSPQGRACIYMYQRGRRGKCINQNVIYKCNILLIKLAALCSVDLLHVLNSITETIQEKEDLMLGSTAVTLA